MTDSQYVPIPGSRALKTRARRETPGLVALEESDLAAPVALSVNGESLARTVVRDHFVPVLLDVFDRLAFSQDAVEQTIYLHLYRLALGDERNFCRVTKRDLMARTNLSERRLLKGLAGLVEKTHVSLVHRDRAGTLYRVHLPHEVFAESAKDAVLMTRPTARSAPAVSPVETVVHSGSVAAPGVPQAVTPSFSPPRTPTSGNAAPAPRKTLPPKKTLLKEQPSEPHTLLNHTSIGALAEDFCRRFGGPGRDQGSVLDEVLNAVEDGQHLANIAESLHIFAREAPGKTPIDEFARFMERRAQKRK